jgi:hypothetical protein
MSVLSSELWDRSEHFFIFSVNIKYLKYRVLTSTIALQMAALFPFDGRDRDSLNHPHNLSRLRRRAGDNDRK